MLLKNLISIVALFLTSITCHSQMTKSTFQGEIEGVSAFIIHLKIEDNSVEGFYKYMTDSTTVFLKGSSDDAGSLSLTGVNSSYPKIKGKLTDRLIEGNIVLSDKAEPHLFYAVDFRGEYRNQYYSDYLRLSLSENGYLLRSLNYNNKKEQISTFRSKDGRICLRADSLNTTMCLYGDTLVVDTLNGLPLFLSPNIEYSIGDLSFTINEELWSSESFVEFPEKQEDFNPEGNLLKLNDTILVRLSRISKSDYIISKWTAPRNRSYEVITEYAKAKKMLDKKLKPLEKYDPETNELLWRGVEITYNDGTKKVWDWYYDLGAYPEAFYAYYPELDILIIEGEAAGDEIIDFNDSSFRYDIGNPAQTATSPNGEWRVTGYYPGGAADTDDWWLERWNASLKKYERVLDFKNNYRVAEKPAFIMPEYIDGWLWVDEHTVLFKSQLTDGPYYKIELMAH